MFAETFHAPHWSADIARAPRFKRWRRASSDAAWIENRDFGTLGFDADGPDGRVLYVATAAPVFVTVEAEEFIAWPRRKNWFCLSASPRPRDVATARIGLPIFKVAVDALTYFVEHFCWTRVVLFEVQHGECTGYVPVAQLSSGEFAVRLQDRFKTFADAERLVFEKLAAFFVLTKPTVFMQDSFFEKRNKKFADAVLFQEGEKEWNAGTFWKTTKEHTRVCPFEYPPSFFRWHGTAWKRTKFSLGFGTVRTAEEGEHVYVSVQAHVPRNITLVSAKACFKELFKFEPRVASAGLSANLRVEITKAAGGMTEFTLKFQRAQYAGAFVSIKSDPWAYLSLRLCFAEGHPEILVVGIAAPRYIRGDIRHGILHASAPDPQKFYYSMKHRHLKPGPTEIARYIADTGSPVSVLRTAKPLRSPEATGLYAGELLILVRFLTSLKQWFKRKNRWVSIPLYPRTSAIQHEKPGLLDVMSAEAKMDRCGVLLSPLLDKSAR
ncbi:MAG: hypothetical protein ACPGR8_15020 [Limisphaerales bacterium]